MALKDGRRVAPRLCHFFCRQTVKAALRDCRLTLITFFRRSLPSSCTGMVKRITNAKIACLDFSLQKTKMKMGVQVIINDPEKLDQIRQR